MVSHASDSSGMLEVAPEKLGGTVEID